MVFPFLFVSAYERPVFIKVEKQITLFGFDLCKVLHLLPSNNIVKVAGNFTTWLLAEAASPDLALPEGTQLSRLVVLPIHPRFQVKSALW